MSRACECSSEPQEASYHPLAPISSAEIDRAAAVIKSESDVATDLRFVSIELREPDKHTYLAWRDLGGPRPAREAFVVLLDLALRRGCEAIVSLDDNQLISYVSLPPEIQPATYVAEVEQAAEAVRHDERFIQALTKRGISDPAKVHIEAWTVGAFEEGKRRLVRAISWLTEGEKTRNPYARPLYGLVAVVDLYSMQVLRVDDPVPGVSPPEIEYPYHGGGGTPYRDDIKPIEISQPHGPSFSLDGHRLMWQKWDLVVGFHPREGLILHDITYADNGRARHICHRASIAELVIPYGDPNPTVHFKNVFDTGEFGIGPLTNSLTLGCDCLGEIRYLDAVVNEPFGSPTVIPNAICIHEEDQNILWKHTTSRGVVDRARSRRLVISSIATVGNYEYGYFWYFYQDGSWEFEAKLTGIVHTAGALPGDRSQHSLPLGEGLTTALHQHFFCARLDLDIDGTTNVAFQTDAVRDDWSSDNPDGTAFRTHRTTFETESKAQTSTRPESARRFRVENTECLNRIGDAVSYELVPGENTPPMQQENSSIRGRARMLDHQLWVTPYRREERYPAGEYPNQSAPGEGLPQWTDTDRDILETDIVLWYVFGAHHAPRLEDWPVMPVSTIGFQLRPVGFFDYNPGLDVPPPTSAHCD